MDSLLTAGRERSKNVLLHSSNSYQTALRVQTFTAAIHLCGLIQEAGFPLLSSSDTIDRWLYHLT